MTPDWQPRHPDGRPNWRNPAPWLVLLIAGVVILNACTGH